MDRQTIGKDAEHAAHEFLLRRGCTLIHSNYHCRFGEIDLIMQQRDLLLFVEVRLRSNRRYGSAADSVTHHKQQRLIQTAQHFLSTYPDHQQSPCRFDVVAFSSTEALSSPLWYKDAFRP